MLNKLLHYKRWANQLTFETVLALDPHEATKHRPTRWESIAYTLSHVWAVDDIFRHHLEGRRHNYSFRNINERLSVDAIWGRQKEMDDWYITFATTQSADRLSQPIDFEYVGGGHGRMSPEEMMLHLINHGTYHRGLVSDMLYQIPIMPQTNDLTVFLRNHWHSIDPQK